MENELIEKTVYWLDRNDQLVRVCSSWNRFALANEGDEVVDARVVGRPLLDFISGDATRMWVKTLLMLARVRQESIDRTYRCDSPLVQRYMRMTVIPEPEQVLRIEHAVIETSRNERPVHISPAGACTLNYHRRCSICGRIRTGDAWTEPAGHACGNMEDVKVLRLTVVYTVCADCSLTVGRRQGEGIPGALPG